MLTSGLIKSKAPTSLIKLPNKPWGEAAASCASCAIFATCIIASAAIPGTFVAPLPICQKFDSVPICLGIIHPTASCIPNSPSALPLRLSITLNPPNNLLTPPSAEPNSLSIPPKILLNTAPVNWSAIQGTKFSTLSIRGVRRSFIDPPILSAIFSPAQGKASLNALIGLRNDLCIAVAALEAILVFCVAARTVVKVVSHFVLRPWFNLGPKSFIVVDNIGPTNFLLNDVNFVDASDFILSNSFLSTPAPKLCIFLPIFFTSFCIFCAVDEPAKDAIVPMDDDNDTSISLRSFFKLSIAPGSLSDIWLKPAEAASMPCCIPAWVSSELIKLFNFSFVLSVNLSVKSFGKILGDLAFFFPDCPPSSFFIIILPAFILSVYPVNGSNGLLYLPEPPNRAPLLANKPIITGNCPSSPSKKKPSAISPCWTLNDFDLPPFPVPPWVDKRQCAQGKSSFDNSSSSRGWYPRIRTFTLAPQALSTCSIWCCWTSFGATCPIHQRNPSFPIKFDLNKLSIIFSPLYPLPSQFVMQIHPY